ncbi:hypothetical protein HELRODRAFT_95527 [Helobdella robusta]|uniref:Heat shock 70 kDa protein 14 n=1 Tax=Helobdella robusta TaxID=6412 RepID=T1G966_HELRO|nr:hypothetical protein HELRODRAFT_95527 [Helobdella robusta]ESN96624.1 hypothetical protein HELRODRAFT_95527 [Helobdella robusta]
MSSSVFGIHFGSSTACIAVCRDGKSQVIANDLGDRVTPAVVAFNGNEISIGLAAKHNAIRNAANTIFNVKTLVGRKFDDGLAAQLAKSTNAKIINKNNEPMYQVTYQDKISQYRVVDIVKLVYKKIMETAKSFGCQTNTYDTVVAVPSYFDEQQRSIIKEASKSAGFNVLRVINECSSAVLAYDVGQSDLDKNLNVLVFRAGGHSLDVSVVSVVNGMYRIVGQLHDDSLGGHIIDDLLVKFLVDEFKRQSRLDCKSNERSIAKLLLAVENCKHALSNLPTSTCSVESLYEGVDFSCVISRSRLDALSASFVQSCVSVIKQVVAMAGLNLNDIDKVIMSGGVSKMASLQQNIRDMFASAEFLNTISGDEVVAVGAALQASILVSRNPEETNLFSNLHKLPCLPKDIFIELQEGKHHLLFERLTAIPFRRQVHFSLGQGQTSAILHILQGYNSPAKNKPKMLNGLSDGAGACQGDNGDDGNDNKLESLLKIVLPNVSEDGIVDVVFHFKHDGGLHVICTSANQTQDFTVDSMATVTSPTKHLSKTKIDSDDVGSNDVRTT